MTPALLVIVVFGLAFLWRARAQRLAPEAERPVPPFAGAYAAAVDRHLDGLWDWRPLDGAEYYSPRFCRMLGYESLPPDPQWWQENIHPDDLERSLANWARHVESGGSHPYDQIVRYRHADGHEVIVHCRGEVTEWTADGRPRRAQGVHVDMTHLLPADFVERVVLGGGDARDI